MKDQSLNLAISPIMLKIEYYKSNWSQHSNSFNIDPLFISIQPTSKPYLQVKCYKVLIISYLVSLSQEWINYRDLLRKIGINQGQWPVSSLYKGRQIILKAQAHVFTKSQWLLKSRYLRIMCRIFHYLFFSFTSFDRISSVLYSIKRFPSIHIALCQHYIDSLFKRPSKLLKNSLSSRKQSSYQCFLIFEVMLIRVHVLSNIIFEGLLNEIDLNRSYIIWLNQLIRVQNKQLSGVFQMLEITQRAFIVLQFVGYQLFQSSERQIQFNF